MGKLFDGQTADGQSAAEHIADAPGAIVFCEGDFDGATVTLQMRESADSATWHNIVQFTAAGVANVVLPSSVEVRGDLASASASTSIIFTVSPRVKA